MKCSGYIMLISNSLTLGRKNTGGSLPKAKPLLLHSSSTVHRNGNSSLYSGLELELLVYLKNCIGDTGSEDAPRKVLCNIIALLKF